MSDSVLVTGATGNVGLEVVRGLYASGGRVRAAVLDVSRDGAILPSGTQVVRFDFTDPATFAAALEGVQRVFLVRPPQMSRARTFVPFLEAARGASIEQIVFLSLLGAEKNGFVPHRGIEDAILRLGLGHVFLRPSFFMQNLSGQHRDDIRLRNEINVPAGNGTTSFIDARDIAAVAVGVLHTGEVGVAFDLTGPQALDYADVARIFSEVLGREIRYTRPDFMRFAVQERARGVPWAFVIVMLGIYGVARFGGAGRVTDDAYRILGREPIRLRQFVEDYRALWMP